ncbi:hypothetical protein J437_LFUL008096 [Ladona fulva]|uniref:Uncharacterized protein n=1 Tax=Ladona fulva TaxID=123851 RepID=A0A8K0KBV8_LADFU|nr:hypothetical protein J437_LFUL008096 [Ladona fulva]
MSLVMGHCWQSGIAIVVKEHHPDITFWHCLNQRLELAIGDSVKEIHRINHIQACINKLYSVYTFVYELYSAYSTSPKNKKGKLRFAFQLE